MNTSCAQPPKSDEPQTLDLSPIHDLFAHQAVKNFNKDGRVYSNVFFIELARPVTRQPKPVRSAPLDPKVTHTFMSSQENRDQFSRFLRDTLTANTPTRQSISKIIGFEPDLIVHIDEAWTATPRPGEDPANVLPSQRVDRREIIIVSVHHRWGGTVLGMHPIIQMPKRHAKFQKLPSGMITVTGRLAMTPDNQA